ncbi:unnamed protein product, partial [Tetraodon nigroviridis]
CFRELCALCWMLHVRDQLSVYCRKYQAARQHGGNDEAVDTLVRAFPENEESVRVPLREKYKSLLQRVKKCSVPGHQTERGLFGSSASTEAAVELQQNLDPELEAQFPKLSRLLEWMVRWADRRVLVPPNSQGKKEESGGAVKEGVMIRVKASAPAILTSLSLLWRRHAALLSDDHHGAYTRVPQTQWTVTPVLQTDGDRRLERESSVDTGYPGSANTPITAIDDSTQQAEPFIGQAVHGYASMTYVLHLMGQNINYMSLMEVLGASFSNLQLAQQSYSLAQSNTQSSGDLPVCTESEKVPQRPEKDLLSFICLQYLLFRVQLVPLSHNPAFQFQLISSSPPLTQLVRSTEKSPVSPLSVKSTGAVKKTVRLALPREAWTPRQDVSSHASNFEENEENVAKEPVDSNKSWSPYPMSCHGSSNRHHLQITRIEPDTSGISSLMEESENLGQPGLSDTIEILDELVREGYLSLTNMDWTSSQAEHHSRLDQQQNGWMLQEHIQQDEEREELRTWMRKKQRERLAVYQKHRESLREKEHKPFSSAVTVKPKTKNPAAIQKIREEKQKNMLLEQFSQRTRITVKQPLLKNILILDKIDLSLLFGLQYRFQTTAGGWDCIGQVRQHSATCNLL